MAIEKVIDLQIKSNAEQAVGSLKSQLRAAQNEVSALADKFGATSQQAVEAAKRAGELKDKISDAKSLTDAFNPDAKFKALSSSLSGVAGGFAAVQGGMALFGAQSADVEKTLLKVQSAMALSQGLQTIGESVDSFKQLGAVVKSYSIVQKLITAGQWLWNAAMTANPLGAIVLAITAVIAAGYGLIKFFGNVATTSKVAMQGIKENSKALEDSKRITEEHNQALKDSADYNLAMAKASGNSAAEIRKLSITEANADISLKALNRTIAQNTYYRELNSLANLKAGGATEEAIKMQDELTKKSLENFANENKALTESVRSRKLLIQNNNVEIRQEETNHRTKLNDDATAAKTKKEEEAKAEAKRLKEEKDKAVISEAEAYRNQLEAVQKVEADAKKANADALLTEQQLAIQKENEDFEAKKARAILYGTSFAEIKTQHLNNLNEINLNAQGKQYAEDKEFADKKIAIDKASTDAKRNALDTGLGILQQFAGKNKAIALTILAIQKGLAIADVVVGSSKAIASATANLASVPAFIGLVPNPAYIGQAIATAKGISTTKISATTSIASILAAGISTATSITGGSGGGGSSAPSGGGISGSTAPTAPSFNVVGTSGTNQLAQSIGQQQQQPIRTFVVANDMTTAQSLNRNIIQSASIGG